MRLICVISALALAAACGQSSQPTACTVQQNGDGSATISCPDGSSATINNGTNGSDGANGANGHAAVIAVREAAVGDCPAGGKAIDLGIDDGAGGGTADDGVLQAGEVDSTTLLCNGSDGANGSDGTNGVDGSNGDDALIALSDASLAQCPAGGKVVTAGVDDGSGGGVAGDGVLQPGEIDSTAIVCSGTNCTVTNHGDGTSTMSCQDGTSSTWWSGIFPQASAGPNYGCGIRASDANLRCWGSAPGTVPAGPFASVSSGGTNACAVRADGSAACWGSNAAMNAVPAGSYRSIDVGGWSFGGTTFACGVRADRTLGCWGVYPGTPPSGTFLAVAGGYTFACGIRTDGTLTCWGAMNSWTATPTGTFKAISGGFNQVCALSTSNTAACWGFSGGGGLALPSGTYKSVAAGYDFSCGVRDTNGAVVCAGFDNGGVVSTAPAGIFVSVTAGDASACAVREDGEVVCWGNLANPAAADFP